MDKHAYEMNLIRWTDTIQRCRDRGMSIRSWCTQNNISEKNLLLATTHKRKSSKTSKITEVPIQVYTPPNFVKLSAHAESIRSSSFKTDIMEKCI